jgi:hypothetical protein
MDFRKSLQLTSAVAAALLASGCGGAGASEADWTAQKDTQICTDEKGERVDDENCKRTAHAGSGAGFFAWYYLSRGGAIPGFGQKATGGATFPSNGVKYAEAPSSTRVARGGFGSSARSAGRSSVGA